MENALVIIEMVDYQTYKLCCGGEWVTIRQGEFGFIDLTKVYPIVKAVHKMICDSCTLD